MYRRLKSGNRPQASYPGSAQDGPPEVARDSDQPFIYDIRFSKRKFTLELYDTSNPNQHWSTLKPDVVVIAFDISNRETLAGLKGVSLMLPVEHIWKPILTNINSGEMILHASFNMVRANEYP